MLGFLPETHTDFIFSNIAEETGFWGSLTLLFFYLGILFCAIRTALLCRDQFGKNIAIGIAILIFTHSVINIGMSIRLMPVTGLPLPLVSYGGSFIISTLIYLGLLHSVYVHRKIEE
jgi:rod shape determining protein RodA